MFVDQNKFVSNITVVKSGRLCNVCGMTYDGKLPTPIVLEPPQRPPKTLHPVCPYQRDLRPRTAAGFFFLFISI